MIVELGPPEPRESLRAWVLPGVLTFLLLSVLATAAEPAVRVAPITVPAPPKPAVLAAARVAPHQLVLTDDVARRVSAGAGNVTGMASAAVLAMEELWWQYRLPDGRDARLARAPRGGSFIMPPNTTDVTVRGVPGRAFTTRAGAAVVWSERGASYQLSSRALTADELVLLAAALVPD